MSQLLKAGHVTIATGRKALEARTAIQVETKRLDQRADQPHAPQSGDEQAERLKHRIAELEQAAADQVRQCETLEQAAYQRGMDEGMQLGAATVKRDHEAQLATLREGVQAALEAFAEQLRAIEPLALEMTLIALEKILGDPAAYAELIGQTTRHHLAQVTANSTVGVRVSAADFPDADNCASRLPPLAGIRRFRYRPIHRCQRARA